MAVRVEVPGGVDDVVVVDCVVGIVFVIVRCFPTFAASSCLPSSVNFSANSAGSFTSNFRANSPNSISSRLVISSLTFTLGSNNLEANSSGLAPEIARRQWNSDLIPLGAPISCWSPAREKMPFCVFFRIGFCSTGPASTGSFVYSWRNASFLSSAQGSSTSAGEGNWNCRNLLLVDGGIGLWQGRISSKSKGKRVNKKRRQSRNGTNSVWAQAAESANCVAGADLK